MLLGGLDGGRHKCCPESHLTATDDKRMDEQGVKGMSNHPFMTTSD